jgi:hypothetical protein
MSFLATSKTCCLECIQAPEHFFIGYFYLFFTIFPNGHNNSSYSLVYHIGGSPQTPELQVGQLDSENSLIFEPGLKKEEMSFIGFGDLQLGQLKLELSSPIDWRTSNLSPQLVH